MINLFYKNIKVLLLNFLKVQTVFFIFNVSISIYFFENYIIE